MVAAVSPVDADHWQHARVLHRAWIERTLTDHQERAARSIAHPVEDFLFEYYWARVTHLARWSPGIGVVLEGDVTDLDLPLKSVDGGHTLDLSGPADRRQRLARTRDLLARTVDRTPSYGCFGLHEWAMVHRADQVRHPQLGLRLADDDVAAVVEERGVRCTHFDAYRFFTPSAKPFNQRPLSRDTQPDDEQPGCLHATMDLYKWATKLGLAAPSAVVRDCFDLALDVRWIDMRASPYDLSSLPDPGGHIRTTRPIAVETARGRAEYVEHQRAFTERAAPLRAQLVELHDAVLAEPQNGFCGG